MAKEKINKKTVLRRYLLVATIFIVAILLSFGIYSVAYSGRVFAHQYLGETKVGGLSKKDLASKVDMLTRNALTEKIILTNRETGKSYEILPADIGLSYDQNKTVETVWSYGRESNIGLAFVHQLYSIFRKSEIGLIFTINTSSLNERVAKIALENDQPEKDYTISYKEGKFVLNEDRQTGKRIHQKEIIAEINKQIADGKIRPIDFQAESFEPVVSKAKALIAVANANNLLAKGEVSLKYNDQVFTIDRETIAGFLATRVEGDNLVLITNSDRLSQYVAGLAQSIDMTPLDAKLTITNGKVTVFQNSRQGRTLDQKQTALDIENTLFSRIQTGITTVDPSVIKLSVTTNDPNVTSSTIASLGINELVATASTNFTGSPANRIHNITVGANAINGVLLAPNEEFSTIKHLGAIDASGGYLQELVIKDNKTVPEFGGGLCQVSSTLFRTALNAGMRITERDNHAYRVSYYEPPVGMDATIYDPSPDFRFINNYRSHILIQSKIVGTSITFEFYGTKDSREISISTPTLSDVTKPGPPIYTETDTLAAGVTKRVERAHDGGTARFDYRVVSKSGEILQQKTFVSKYVSWQEKWLVGVGTNVPANCSNGVQDGDETAVDAGGSCPRQAP